tara:strand:- start:292 stop:591 length:300 start_codon:yes stop_codon:yes gene_type:complete
MTTAEDARYEGWTNRETWNTNLWISNSEPIYKLVLKLMGNASGSATTGEFADNLEGFLWIVWDGKTPDGYRLNPVNWVEIATSFQEVHTDYLDSLDAAP